MRGLDLGVVDITIKLGKKTHSFNLADQLNINTDDINTELMDQPGKFAWFGVLAELAHIKALIRKDHIDVVEAKVDRIIRKRARVAETHKSEKQIEKEINRHEDVIKAKEEYYDAKRDASILFVAKKAFEQRKDTLASLTVNLRGQGLPLDPELDDLRRKYKKERGSKH